MRYLIIFKLLLSLAPSLLNAQNADELPTLIFAVNSPGSRPYVYFDAKQQSYAGLARDFFDHLEQKGLLRTTFVDSNRTRSEEFLLAGKVDVFLSNPQWLDNPSLTIASAPFMLHHTFLYSTSPFATDFSLEYAAAQNKKVCTRQGFVYPGLQPYFSDHSLQRIDSTSQPSMAAMLVKQRCDYMVMNDYNAEMTFAQEQFCGVTIYQSPQPSSSVELNLIMRRDRQALKTIIDQNLKEYSASGKLQHSLAAHSQTGMFPKITTCNQM